MAAKTTNEECPMYAVMLDEAELDLSWERRGDGCAVLRLQGELELYTAQRLEREGDRVASSDGDRVILDLSRISFIDSAGMSAIVRLYKRVHGRTELCLVLQQGECRRMLDRTQLTRLLRTYGSVQDAVADAA
jgi:anti-sigma B factor antagonist